MKRAQKPVIIVAILSLALSGIFFLLVGFKNIKPHQQNPTTHIVTIYQMKFDPQNIKVKKGDIVEWVNKDFVPHDVTEIDRKWTSKPLQQGNKFSKVITKDFNYFCSIHLVMKGSVTLTN